MRELHEHQMHIWYFWWLIFPIMGVGISIFKSWLRYRRHKDLMDLLRAYASQGRDPPQDLLARLADPTLTEPDRSLRGVRMMWIPAVILLALASAFAALSFMAGGEGDFMIPVVLLGALGLAFLGIAVVSRRLGAPADTGRDGR